MLPKKTDNQYTMPPMTKEQAMKKFLEVLKTDHPNKGPGPTHNWPMIFGEWLIFEGQINKFCALKSIHPGTIQTKGGRTIWLALRDAVRKKGLELMLEKMPNMLEKKFEKQFKVITKLEDVIEKSADRLLIEPEPPIEPGNIATDEQRKQYKLDLAEYKRAKSEHHAEALKTLAEAVEKLVDSNLKLRNDGVQKIEAKSLNLHGTMMEAMKARDQQYGIKD